MRLRSRGRKRIPDSADNVMMVYRDKETDILFTWNLTEMEMTDEGPINKMGDYINAWVPGKEDPVPILLVTDQLLQEADKAEGAGAFGYMVGSFHGTIWGFLEALNKAVDKAVNEKEMD